MDKAMGFKVSAVLIVTFLITMVVFMGRPQATVVAVKETAVPTAVATQLPPTRIAFDVPTAMPTTVPTIVPTAAPTDVLAPVVEPTTMVLASMTGDKVRGEDIFRHGFNEAPPCITCHSPVTAGKGTFSIGPGLLGISERAATRVEGETAEQYIAHSIRKPTDFLVPGFNPVMPGIFGETYTDQDIADIVAYLMSL
jgi:cytochrome c2